MGMLPFLLLPAVIYAIPVAIGVFLMQWAGDKRMGGSLWPSWIAPIVFWIVMVVINDKGKTLSNLIFEPLILAGATLLVSLLSLILLKRGILIGPKLIGVSLAVSLTATFLVFRFVKAMPE